MRIPTGVPIGLVAKIIGPQGFREIDMILDTGAAYTTISWDVARDIGYDPAIAEKRAHIITANGVVEVPLIVVQSICFGELKLDNVEVVCHDIPELIEIEGMLGLSFLRHFKTNINYKEKFVEIIDP